LCPFRKTGTYGLFGLITEALILFMVLFIKSRYILDMSQLLLLDGAPGGASPELFRSLKYPDSGGSGNLHPKIV
jgi:hypothetical protein